jgi:hypothetical protein
MRPYENEQKSAREVLSDFFMVKNVFKLAPGGAWLRQKSCERFHLVACGIKEAGFA